MRILVAPVVVGDRICRIVSPVRSLLEVEEWAGAWWEPSLVTLTEAVRARPATPAELRARGVPKSDRTATDALTPVALQAMLCAAEPARPGLEAAAPARRPRRSYPGNARFRRPPSDRDPGDARS